MCVSIEELKQNETLIFDFFLNYCYCEGLIRDKFPEVIVHTPQKIVDYAKEHNFAVCKDNGIDITKLKSKIDFDSFIIDEIFNRKLGRPSCRKIRNKLIHSRISRADFEYFIENAEFLINQLALFNNYLETL